jgi:hypothetical protein
VADKRAHSGLFRTGLAAAIAVVFAPQCGRAEPLGVEVALSPAAACTVAKHTRRFANRTLVLEGAYQWDWEWGAFLNFRGCKEPLPTVFDEKLSGIRNKLAAGAVMQGSAKVIFEGQIVPAKTCAWQGQPRLASRCDYFNVTRIEAFELEHGVGS